MMSRPLRIEYPGALYHITSRGNGKQDIFFNDSDRCRFLDLFSTAIERNQWLCHSYCLMSNHYHLLIETPEPTLSRGMRFLNSVYSQYINRRHHRIGHVFQGRFHAILVERDSYLLELSRYIVLNPVRAQMVESAEDWEWSSYRGTADLSPAPEWLTTEWVLGIFSKKRTQAVKNFQRFISAGNERPSPFNALKNQIYLGSEAFIKETQRKLNPEQSLNDIPKPQKSTVRKPLAFYEKKGGSRLETMAMAYRSGCYTLAEIGSYFGVSNATVSRAVKVLECKM